MIKHFRGGENPSLTRLHISACLTRSQIPKSLIYRAKKCCGFQLPWRHPSFQALHDVDKVLKYEDMLFRQTGTPPQETATCSYGSFFRDGDLNELLEVLHLSSGEFSIRNFSLDNVEYRFPADWQMEYEE
ncbi:hypothetical protein VNI00_013471 [Paramarasmius palmivorus]|uniref:Uncharacterized protein n=1 Tax=Paramarasmius palmivorus TaxID=297713 RepID=A0AAW0C026_9AGAR